MTPTTEYLRTQFAAFNVRYFGGLLPEPLFQVNRARTVLGRFSCRKVRQGLLGLRSSEEYTIAVSRFYELSERDVQTVLLHEMIHFHIRYHHMTDTAPHGKLFRSEMERINADGWSISVRTNTKGWQPSAGNCRSMRCVVAITSADGCYFAAVQRPYVRAFDRAIVRFPGLKRCEWFVTGDSFFRKYPLVRTLRFHPVPTEEFNAVCKRMTDNHERIEL